MNVTRPAFVAAGRAQLVAADDPTASTGGDAIKGIWAVESMTYEGNRAPDDRINGALLTAYDGKDYFQRQGGTIIEEGSYVLDPSKSPKAIDFLIRTGASAGKRQLGIYELDGNNLRVCVAAPGSTRRPRSFEAAGTLLVVNRRFRP